MAARRILTLAACSALISAHAAGSPRSDPTSGRAVFTGATTPHATSITLSPAAIANGLQNELYVALASTLAHTSIDGDLGTIDDTTPAPGGVVSYLWRTSDRLRVGFEARLPPPEQLLSGYDSLRYHTLGIGDRRYAATVGVGVRVTSRLLVGASLTHENIFLKLRYARDTALARGRGPTGIDGDCSGAPCGIGNPDASELYAVDVRSRYLAAANLKVNIGAVVRVAADVWIAVAYHTPPGGSIQTALDGTMSIARAPRDGGGTIGGASTVYVSYPASVDGEVRAGLPLGLELHVGGRWEDLSRMQTYDVRFTGSKLAMNDIPEWQLRARGLHDTFALWGGVEQVDTGEIARFGGRLGFETSSHDVEKTSPMAISPFAFTIDAGVQLRAQRGSNWMLQLSYGLALSPTAEVSNSAYAPDHLLDCIDSGFDYTTAACAGTRNGYALTSANGSYLRIEHALRLGLRYDH